LNSNNNINSIPHSNTNFNPLNGNFRISSNNNNNNNLGPSNMNHIPNNNFRSNLNPNNNNGNFHPFGFPSNQNRNNFNPRNNNNISVNSSNSLNTNPPDNHKNSIPVGKLFSKIKFNPDRELLFPINT
jgi:hypothetical protein